MTAGLTDYDGQLAQLGELQRLLESGKFREGLDLAASLIARWPDFAPFQLMRGRSLLGLGDYQAAMSCFRKALDLKPGDVNSADGLATCLQKVGRADEVVPTFAELYYEQPGHGTATSLLRAALGAEDVDHELIEMLLKGFYPDYFEQHADNDVVLSPYVALDDWCAANGIRLDTYDPGGRISLTHVDGSPVPPYDAPAVQFATIPGASVVAGLDWVIAPSGEFLDGSGLQPLTKIGDRRYGSATFVPFISDPARNRLLHARAKTDVDVDEDVVFLSTYREHHFGHWILDYLPRLMAWRRPGAPPRKVYTLANLPDAQRDTLAHFGVQPADLVQVPADGRVYRFRSVTALRLGDTQRPAPSMVRFTYSHLAAKQTPLPPGVSGGRYFLARSQTKRGRNIANRDEFQAVLDEFGFETVRRPEVSVAEQDAKFSEASIILTPFGSDYVTFFQLRPGSDFIVLNFENMEQVYPGIEPIAPRYCAILGMRYHAVECGLFPRKGKIAYHGDMIVDCDTLRRTLAEITARRAGEELHP
jgi:capsular polysaccharide biosynthesis protein